MPLMAIRPSPALDTTGPPRPSVVVFITAARYLGTAPFGLDQAGNAGWGEDPRERPGLAMHVGVVVQSARKRSGKKRARGRIRCIPVHQKLPEARILPERLSGGIRGVARFGLRRDTTARSGKIKGVERWGVVG